MSVFYFLVAVLGLVIGSFLNVVISRVRTGEFGWRARSRCPDCHVVLRPSELIPLLSFALLRGRCRSCRKSISWQYPIVEAVTAAFFVIALCVRSADGPLDAHTWLLFGRDALFSCFLIVIFAIDALDMLVYDSVVLTGAAVAFLCNLALGVDPRSLALGVLVGSGFFLLQYAISKGRWIGAGDIRIGAMMGAMLGFHKTVFGLFLAYALGAVYALALLASGRKEWGSQLAFGTFLSVATAAALLWGDRLIAWYGGLLF